MRKTTPLISGLAMFRAEIYAQRVVAVKSKLSMTNPEGNRCLIYKSN
jgi:hypothetical protein